MQARLSAPSSLAAHHRRLMASCAESGCPQVRQRSGWGAKLSAPTVGESPCMSKSVEAPLQGPDSERQGPTNRMSAAMFSGSPHSTRTTTPDRTERQDERPERGGRRGQLAPGSAFPRDAATADQRLMTRTLPLPPLQAEAAAGLPTDFGIIHCG